MTQHDNSYKLLFSHPQMVQDLLTGFVHEPWVTELDFSTLEAASGSYVADDLRDREDDIVWRLRFKDGWPRWQAANNISELIEAPPGRLRD
jgi:predicted transposase YdaD